MGTFGTAISSNDTYADIYGHFFDLYNSGLEVREVSEKLIVDHQEIINDIDDCNNFWFALAKAQWECKQLDRTIFKKVKGIIESGVDLEVWRQLDASEKDIQKRKVVLDKFLTELQKDRPKAKVRKKKIIRQPAFEKGDCLTFKLQNGNYGGAVVLEAIYNTEFGYNLIATTRINQSAKPIRTDFENAEVLVINFGHWADRQSIQWYNPIRYKKIAHLIEKVAGFHVERDYEIGFSKLPFMSDFDIFVIEQVSSQFEFEKIKPRPTVKFTINEFIKRRR